MTNFNSEQFDLIKNRLDRVEAIAESNARGIAANSNQISETERVLSEAIGRTLGLVERIAETTEEQQIELQEYRQRNDAQMTSLNATVERLETILNRLIQGG